MSARILLVLSDPDARSLATRTLRPSGYELLVHADPESVGLPTGLQCAVVDASLWPALKQRLEAPYPRILMVVPDDGTTPDVSEAHDVLMMPLTGPELELRVEAQFRMLAHPNRVFRLEDCIVDLARQRVHRPGRSVALSDLESTLIEAFVESEGRPLTWDSLGPTFGEREDIEELVRELRKKVETNPADPQHIVPVYGSGVRFVRHPPVLTNLFADQSPFVGRLVEQQALKSLLEDGHRFVCLQGPSGVGKTRLCREVGRRLAKHAFPGGVWFCDLSSAQSIADILTMMARSLRVPVYQCGSVHDATDAMTRAIEYRGRSLLILDHVDWVGAKLIGAVRPLIASCPDLVFITTSQGPVHVDPKEVVHVGLLTPDAAQELAALRGKLSASRLPLTIELGLPTADPDPKTELNQALEEAWSRLGNLAVLAESCALFHHGFSEDAFEAILGGSEKDLKALATAGLLRSFDATTRRWGMNSAIAEFARKRLRKREDHAELTGRHRDYYLAYAKSVTERIQGVDGYDALGDLRREHGNLLAVLHRSTDDAPKACVELMIALNTDRELAPPLDVQLAILDRSLEKASKIPAGIRAAGRLLRARVRLDKGLFDSVAPDIDYALKIAEDLQLVDFIARCHRLRGNLYARQGQRQLASRYYERCVQAVSIAVDSDIHAQREGGRCRAAMARLAFNQGELEQAEELVVQAEEHLRRIEDRSHLWPVLDLGGRIAALSGRVEVAALRTGEALDISLRYGLRLGQATALLSFGLTHVTGGDFSQAIDPVRQAVYLFGQCGVGQNTGKAMFALGFLRHQQLQFEEADALYHQALRLLDGGPIRAATAIYAMACKADLDELDEAMAMMETHGALRVRHPELVPLLDLCEAHRNLALSRAALAKADKDQAAHHLDWVMERVREASNQPDPRSGSLLNVLIAPRVAVRVLRAHLDLSTLDEGT